MGIDVLDKSADMLCHNTGLKRFSLQLPKIEGRKKHFGFGKALKMNHTLEHLLLHLWDNSVELDLEELVQPLIMDENGHQANSTLTTLGVSCAMEFSGMSSAGATFARMLRKNSSIKYLDLRKSLTSESDAKELIQSLVENHSLETLCLGSWTTIKWSDVFPAIMDVLLVNFTLKALKWSETYLDHEFEFLVIKDQLRRNARYKVLHLKELEMVKPTSARVIFCGFPYAGMS
jgi:hypothetical protein